MDKKCLALLAVLMLFVTGCSAPSETPTATPTPEPTPVPTPMPTLPIEAFIPSASINEGRPETDKYEIPATVNTLIMPNVFGENMLFQQKAPIRVWGYAPAGTEVSIRLLDQVTGETMGQLGLIAAEDNSFIGELPALDGSFRTYELRVKAGKNAVAYKNIVVGELYVASGQSNMQVWMSETVGYQDELLAAQNYPYLRYYNPPIDPMGGAAVYPNGCQLSPKATAPKWGRVDERSFGGLSAVAYACARELFDRLNVNGAEVPVGIINVPVGGTSIVPWIPTSQYLDDKAFINSVGQDRYVSPEETANGTKRAATSSSALYNTKIAPVTNMNIRGVLWYQGCSDEGYGAEFYEKALEKLVNGWSEAFRYETGKLPFVMCQLAPFQTGGNPQTVEAKVKFNRAFDNFAALSPQTRAVVALYDVPLTYLLGDNEPIHPKDKLPVGRRCAYAMYGLVYDKTADWTFSPFVTDVKTEGNKLILTFASVGDGLKSSDGLSLRGFTVGGQDRIMYEAKARITGKNTVELTSPYVNAPQYATYAYSALNMKSNLVNSAGIAARPYVSTDRILKYYAQHDYTSFDFLEVWRYHGPNQTLYKYAQNVPVYKSEKCTFELSNEKAVAGNSLKLTPAGGEPSLSIIMDYSGEIHQFRQYDIISVCATAKVTKMTVTATDGTVYELKADGTSIDENGFNRYFFRLDAAREMGSNGSYSSVRWATMVSSINICFAATDSPIYVDSMSFGN